MLDHAKTSKSVSDAITLVTPRQPAAAFRRLWCTANRLRVGQKRRGRSGTIKQAEAAMNLKGLRDSTVAAATGRGFKSRQPECPYYRTGYETSTE